MEISKASSFGKEPEAKFSKMAWNMVPPVEEDLQLQDGDFVDDIDDKDVGEVLDFLLSDGTKPPGVGGASPQGGPADGPSTPPKKLPQLKIKREPVVDRENGDANCSTTKPLTINVKQKQRSHSRERSNDLSTSHKKRNSDGFIAAYSLDGDDEVATPTKKKKGSFSANSEGASEPGGVLSRSGSINLGRSSFSDPNNVWDTRNERIRRLSTSTKGSSGSEAEGTSSASFKDALGGAKECTAQELRKYSNGSEEAKFLIRKMKTELRQEYFKLIDKNIISEYDVDNLCLQTLCQLETAEAMGALRVLENESMFSSFRNVSAYLAQIINNLRHEKVKDPMGKMREEASKTDLLVPKSKVKLLPSVQNTMDKLFKSGQVQPNMMTPLLYESLATLPESGALQVLVTIEGIDMAKIRNFTAFFISLVNKCKRESSRQGLNSRYSVTDSPRWTNKKTSPFSHSQPRHFSQHTDENPSRWGASGQQDLKDHSKLQKALGVRTNELHQLSPFATFVPASVALKLQNLHDKGVTFVTVLDERSWKTLGTLEESLAISVVSDVGDRLVQDRLMPEHSKFNKVRNVNAFFLDLVRKQSEMLAAASGHAADALPMHPPPMTNGTAVSSFSPNARHLDPNRFDVLSPGMKKELDLLVSSSCGLLTHEMFDSRALKILNRLGDANMKLVCEQLRKVNTRRVRNLFAFFLGMCRNFLNGELRK